MPSYFHLNFYHLQFPTPAEITEIPTQTAMSIKISFILLRKPPRRADSRDSTRSRFSFFFLFILFYFFCSAAYGVLVPRLGIEPGPLAVRAQSPNHWTARGLPRFSPSLSSVILNDILHSHILSRGLQAGLGLTISFWGFSLGLRETLEASHPKQTHWAGSGPTPILFFFFF